MSDRPIPFSAPMILAILREIEQPGSGKTQTRRVAKFVTENRGGLFHIHNAHGGVIGASDAKVIAYGPDHAPYQVGDRLWVRESLERANDEAIGYPADGAWLPNTPWRWQRHKLPSIHMPRGLSRLTLIVTDVRVQRLQEISEEDAIAEGIDKDYAAGLVGIWGWRDYLHNPNQIAKRHFSDPRESYQTLWGSINGEKHPWNSNPWIVAVTFRPLLGNIANIEASS